MKNLSDPKVPTEHPIWQAVLYVLSRIPEENFKALEAVTIKGRSVSIIYTSKAEREGFRHYTYL